MTGLRRLWSASAAMTALGVGSAVAAVAVLGVLAFDQREVLGAPVWFKPLKFFGSTALYGLTFAWLLTTPMRRSRPVRIVAAVGAGAWTIELALITVQAARGLPSHFNVLTPLDLTIWITMGATATILWLANIVVAGVVLAEPGIDRLRSSAILTGLGLAVFGMALGYLMPTQGDVPTVELGGQMVQLAGAHSVGVSDGGVGLPLLGWSTEGGDLRIPHFVALHGLQVMPLLAVIAGRQRGWTVNQKVKLVRAGALLYAAFVGLLAWQALRGQPLMQPDVATLVVLAVLGAAVAGTVLVVARPRRAATS